MEEKEYDLVSHELLGVEVSPENFNFYKMAIKDDCTEVAITGYKKTKFFKVDTGEEFLHPVL